MNYSWEWITIGIGLLMILVSLSCLFSIFIINVCLISLFHFRGQFFVSMLLFISFAIQPITKETLTELLHLSSNHSVYISKTISILSAYYSFYTL